MIIPRWHNPKPLLFSIWDILLAKLNKETKAKCQLHYSKEDALIKPGTTQGTVFLKRLLTDVQLVTLSKPRATRYTCITPDSRLSFLAIFCRIPSSSTAQFCSNADISAPTSSIFWSISIFVLSANSVFSFLVSISWTAVKEVTHVTDVEQIFPWSTLWLEEHLDICHKYHMVPCK